VNALVYGRRRQGKSTLSLALGLSRSKQVVIFDPNIQYEIEPVVYDSVSLDERISAGHLITIFRPAPTEIEEGFAQFGELVWHWEDLVVIVDETSAVQRANWLHPQLERLVRQGPPSVDLIQSTHRLVDTQRLTRSLATDIFLFQSTLRADLDLIRAEISDQVAEQVKVLPIYGCLHYWVDSGGVGKYSVWTEHEVWYVRIRREQLDRAAS